jgi:hypothetical protein
LNSGSSPWAAPPALFGKGILQHRVSQTICPGWLQTVILLISVTRVDRITGMSHPAPGYILTFTEVILSAHSFELRISFCLTLQDSHSRVPFIYLRMFYFLGWQVLFIYLFCWYWALNSGL